MIGRIRRRLFEVRHQYSNSIERHRARVLLGIVWVITVMLLAWVAFSVLRSDPLEPQTVIVIGLTLLSNAYIHRQIHRGRLTVASWLFAGLLTFNTAFVTILAVPPDQINISTALMIGLTLPLVVAGLLLNRRGMALVAVTLIAAVIYGAVAQNQRTDIIEIFPQEAVILDAGTVILSLVLVSLFLLVFAGNLERTAADSLREVAHQQRMTELGIEIAQMDGLAPMMLTALEIVRGRLGYLFAQFFLVDEDGQLTRNYRYGLGAQETLGGGRTRIPDSSVLVEAHRARRIRVISASSDSEGRHSHLLSAAHYGAVIPLIYREQSLGVMDVQKVGGAFIASELKALELLAGQIAVVLAQTQTIQDLERALHEQEGFTSRLQAQLTEFQGRESRAITGAWASYVSGRGKRAIGYNLEADIATPIPAGDMPEAIFNTLKTGRPQIEVAGDEQIVNVPILFRDQTLGAMSFTVPRDRPIGEKHLEMAETVAGRLALALENTRLFEQSQSQAHRERKASEISSALIGATDVGTVLNLAAESFNEALGAIHTSIYIQPDLILEPLAQTQKEGEQ